MVLIRLIGCMYQTQMTFRDPNVGKKKIACSPFPPTTILEKAPDSLEADRITIPAESGLPLLHTLRHPVCLYVPA